jgi:hypothetical protein
MLISLAAIPLAPILGKMKLGGAHSNRPLIAMTLGTARGV